MTIMSYISFLRGLSNVFQGCFKEISRAIMDVSSIFQGSFKGVLYTIQEGLKKDVSEKCQGNFKSALEVFPGNSPTFWGCLGTVN